MTPAADFSAAPLPGVPHVTCPQCGTRLPCYDPASSRYFACYHCHTYFRALPDVPDSTAHRVDGFRASVGGAPVLPLGAEGLLAGYRCRLTGYQVRCEKQDKQAQYQWREYQLRPLTPTEADDPADFPQQLIEFQGHWLLVRRATTIVKPGSTSVTDSQGREYRLWSRYQPVVRYALGEFDWNILDDEKLQVEEFIDPPRVLVSEQAPKAGKVWYWSEYLEPEAVAAAFAVRPDRLPAREGIGAAQPGPVPEWPQLRRLTVLAALLLLAVQALVLVLHPPGEVLRQQLQAEAPGATGSSQMLTSRPFTLTGTAALTVDLDAPELSNRWVEVTASLVNEQTGQGYEFTRSIEYYQGVEDGESWSEGGTTADAVLHRVPAGRYHLNLYPSLDPTLSSVTLNVRVEQHAVLWSNFWLALLALAALPVVLGWRRRSFEQERWAASDFSPYASSSSDD